MVIISLLAYTILIHIGKGPINGHCTMYSDFINKGLLRAFAGVGTGFLLGDWFKSHYEIIKKHSTTILQQFFFTTVEFMCLFFIINNLFFHKIKYNNQIIFVVTFLCIIYLFLIKKGLISKILDINLWSKMSKYVYSIYMIHFSLIAYYGKGFLKNYQEFVYSHSILNIILIFVVVFLDGGVSYHFIEKPFADRFKKSIK